MNKHKEPKTRGWLDKLQVIWRLSRYFWGPPDECRHCCLKWATINFF